MGLTLKNQGDQTERVDGRFVHGGQIGMLNDGVLDDVIGVLIGVQKSRGRLKGLRAVEGTDTVSFAAVSGGLDKVTYVVLTRRKGVLSGDKREIVPTIGTGHIFEGCFGPLYAGEYKIIQILIC